MNHSDNPAPFDEQQLTRLGLLHQPFADEGFQFDDADIEAARNLAVHLLESSNRLVILSGPPGVGRTAFLRQIAAVHTDELDCCTLGGSPQLRVANIAKMLAMRVGASEIAHEPDALAARLRQAEASGYPPALLIDDAHRLEENTIKGLLLFREAIAKVGGRLPILLAAPTGSEHQLQELTTCVADQDELSEIILPAFTEAQTASYLDQRLAAAGEHTGQLLSAREKRQIHQQARGIPAIINQQTVRLLMDTLPQRNTARPPARRSRWLYAGVATAMLVLVGGLLLTRYLGGPRSAAAPEVGMPLALPSHAGSAPTPPSPAPTGRAGAESTTAAIAQARPPAGVTSPSRPEATQATSGASPMPHSGPALAQNAPTQARPATPENSGPPSSAALLRQAPPQSPKALESTRTTAPEKPADAPPITGSPATATSRPSENWLTSRAGDHYTIQLIAGYEKQTLERFLNQHPLGDKAHAVESQYQGRTWHVLITGDYPSRDAAHNALNRLPKVLRDNGIWVRSFASLRP